MDPPPLLPCSQSHAGPPISNRQNNGTVPPLRSLELDGKPWRKNTVPSFPPLWLERRCSGPQGGRAGGNGEATTPGSGLMCTVRPHPARLGPASHCCLTAGEPEARGRAREAKLPEGRRSGRLPSTISLRANAGPPKVPALLMGTQARACCTQGVLPLLPQTGGKGKAASREERGADVRTNAATCQQNRHLSSSRGDKGGWQGSPRSQECPLCLCVFPGPTKAAAVSLRCHLRLHPLGLW